MYNHVGVTDQLQSVDSELWRHCFEKESKPPPPFLPVDVESDLTCFLENCLHITKDEITHSNCKNVYINLVNEVKEIIFE